MPEPGISDMDPCISEKGYIKKLLPVLMWIKQVGIKITCAPRSSHDCDRSCSCCECRPREAKRGAPSAVPNLNGHGFLEYLFVLGPGIALSDIRGQRDPSLFDSLGDRYRRSHSFQVYILFPA